MGILLSWFVLSCAIYVTALILPGFEVRGFVGAVIVAALFGFLNWLLGWFIFVVLGVATLGLGFLLAFITRWIVTAIVLKITDAFSSNLAIRGLGTAFIGGLLISAFGTFGEYLVTRFMGPPRYIAPTHVVSYL